MGYSDSIPSDPVVIKEGLKRSVLGHPPFPAHTGLDSRSVDGF